MSWVKVFGALVAVAALSIGGLLYLSSLSSEPTVPSAIQLQDAPDRARAGDQTKEETPKHQEKARGPRKPRPGAGEDEVVGAQPAPFPPPCPAGEYEPGDDDPDDDCDDEDDADDLDDEDEEVNEDDGD